MQSPRTYHYSVVDVFMETPFEGNPLAVFLDAAGLSSDEMQTIARELNLAETSFVFRSERAAARVRIFTPCEELPFAGHPTIGTAFALVRDGRVDRDAASFVLEERVGPISIRLERAENPFRAWFRTPPIAFEGHVERNVWANGIGLQPEDLMPGMPLRIVSAGNPFLFVPLRDRATVDRAVLDGATFLRAFGASFNGVFVFAPVPGGAYSRMFAPGVGVVEDPATGSATGPLGAYMAEYGLIPKVDGTRFTSEQGALMKRRSFIHGILHVRANELDWVEIGGSAVAVIQAQLSLP
jgi:trans-2,3-dihydro-3-hydroxyanthranilate isomerase